MSAEGLKCPQMMRSTTTLKEEGNDKFNNGDFDGAMSCYTHALEISEIKETEKAVIFKNRAMCHLKVAAFEEAVSDATKALEIVPNDPKALYRRCTAYERLGKVEDAYRDAAMLIKVDPMNRSVNPLLNRLNPIIRKKTMARLLDSRTVRQSCLLHRLCCDVGFDERRWRQRIRFIDIGNTSNSFMTMYWVPNKYYFQYSGSAAEGVAAEILGSDTDIMIIVHGTRVLQDEDFSPDDADHLFRTLCNYHDAFVRLKLVHIGTTADMKVMPTPNFCVGIGDGSLILDPRAIRDDFKMDGNAFLSGSIVHGPSQTASNTDGEEYDFVPSLHCQTWPNTAERWKERPRRYNWPSQCLMSEIINMGTELVPVGHLLSPFMELEWRLSSSLAEKILVRAFNVVQMQCYFLLKLILKYLIKPHVKDVLCSYHMKIVILQTTENTDPMEWREDNLPNCFMTCLQTLLLFLKTGYLPQYFIETHNILMPKMQGPNRQRILGIVQGLHTEGWECLLRCAPFNAIAADCTHQVYRCPCFVTLWEGRRFVDSCNDIMKVVSQMGKAISLILSNNAYGSFMETIETLLSITSFNETESTHAHYFPSSYAATLMKKIMYSHIGYMLLYITHCPVARRNTKVYKTLQTGQRYMEENCDVDMTSCRLKLATFYLQTGKVQGCIQTVQAVLVQYRMEDTLPHCYNHRRVPYGKHHALRRIVFKLEPLFDDFTSFLSHIALPVTFSPWEICCAPVTIQHLMSTRELYTPHDHEFSNLLYIDGLVYAHYLLHIAYLDIGLHAAARRSLTDLRRVVQDPWTYILYYPEIARQLLTYCEANRY